MKVGWDCWLQANLCHKLCFVFRSDNSIGFGVIVKSKHPKKNPCHSLPIETVLLVIFHVNCSFFSFFWVQFALLALVLRVIPKVSPIVCWILCFTTNERKQSSTSFWIAQGWWQPGVRWLPWRWSRVGILYYRRLSVYPMCQVGIGCWILVLGHTDHLFVCTKKKAFIAKSESTSVE